MSSSTSSSEHDMTSSTSTGVAADNCLVPKMLWNWDTIDSCLISRQWHIRSRAQFAGACIAIFLLAVSLPLFQRLAREYEIHIMAHHNEQLRQARMHIPQSAASSSTVNTTKFTQHKKHPSKFRPNLWQQLLRASLHVLQFVIAYFLMLLAMYFNGYVIICIFAGIYVGFTVFEWEWIESL